MSCQPAASPAPPLKIPANQISSFVGPSRRLSPTFLRLMQRSEWMAEHVAEDLNLDRVGGSSRVEQVSLSSAVQECRGCLTFAVLHLFADECRATTASRNEEKRCGCCP